MYVYIYIQTLLLKNLTAVHCKNCEMILTVHTNVSYQSCVLTDKAHCPR